MSRRVPFAKTKVEKQAVNPERERERENIVFRYREREREEGERFIITSPQLYMNIYNEYI